MDASVLDEYLDADADTLFQGSHEPLGLFAEPQSLYTILVDSVTQSRSPGFASIA